MNNLSGLPEYKIWLAMRGRCDNPNHSSYQRYGARGITVCARWTASFPAFLGDMGPRPTRSHSLDRVDNEGNYEPGNCRWATRTQQTRNMRSNVSITIKGVTRLAVEWADVSQVSHRLILQRIARGVEGEKAVLSPRLYRRREKEATDVK